MTGDLVLEILNKLAALSEHVSLPAPERICHHAGK